MLATSENRILVRWKKIYAIIKDVHTLWKSKQEKKTLNTQ